jgi:hypothetical protein
MTIRKTIAPRVSARASPRFLMNDRFSSSSYAVLMAVIRLLIPPEAAHRAKAIATTVPMPAFVCWLDTSCSWSVMILLASSGSPAVSWPIWLAIWAGSATNP